jgi:GNAT superfamily N-acetyltransferase
MTSTVDPANWIIEPLRPDHDRASFESGEPALGDFLKRLARQQQDRHIGRTFVAVPTPGAKRVLGFYTLSAGSIRFEQLPVDVRRRVPRYPVSIARLGRLAVDRSMHRNGLGAALLRDALLRVARIASTELGIVAVVDAKTEVVSRFYERFGFVSLLDAPGALFMMTETIVSARNVFFKKR